MRTIGKTALRSSVSLTVKLIGTSSLTELLTIVSASEPFILPKLIWSSATDGNLLATTEPNKELAPPTVAPNKTLLGFTSPYAAYSYSAISVAPILAPVAVAVSLPNFAIFAQGIKKVTGSNTATPIRPVITAASF